jgi:hypothetical protein
MLHSNVVKGKVVVVVAVAVDEMAAVAVEEVGTVMAVIVDEIEETDLIMMIDVDRLHVGMIVITMIEIIVVALHPVHTVVVVVDLDLALDRLLVTVHEALLVVVVAGIITMIAAAVAAEDATMIVGEETAVIVDTVVVEVVVAVVVVIAAAEGTEVANAAVIGVTTEVAVLVVIAAMVIAAMVIAAVLVVTVHRHNKQKHGFNVLIKMGRL